MNTEIKCRQYMNFKEKVNNYKMSVMMKKIGELE